MFPSPYGELHFSMAVTVRIKLTDEVSVPLRGTTFLNQKNILFLIFQSGFRPLTGNYISQSWESFWREAFTSVSVPLRGTTFLNPVLWNVRKFFGFPSPYGELHFSMKREMQEKRSTAVSVPLRGTTFLNTISHTPYILWLICPKCV